MKENELLEKKDLREKVIGRTEVLDKVGELILLPNTEFATTEQVTNYYNVGKEAIRQIITRNNDEFKSDGLKYLKGKEIKEKIMQMNNIYNSIKINKIRGGILINNNKIAYSKNSLFPKRAILHIAFYLSESDIARQVRKELLKENPTLYYKLSKGNQLRFKKYETEIKNYLEFSFGKENVRYQVSCGKYMLDFILFDKVHIEVDENGHSGYDKKYEEERNLYILKNTNYYTLRYNPQQQKPYELIQEILNLFDYIGYPDSLLKIA